MKKLRVEYRRDDEGYWIATVVNLRGAHTFGRTIAAARRRLPNAIALFHDGAYQLTEKVVLPDEAEKSVTAAVEARRVLDVAQRDAHDALRRAARKLVHEGLSVRDAGEVLGLSHSRVQQLVSASS